MEKRKKWDIMAEEIDRLAAKIDNLEKSATKETPKRGYSREGTAVNVSNLIAEIPRLSMRVDHIERRLDESTLNTPRPNRVDDRWVVSPYNLRLEEILTSPPYQKLMREKDAWKGQLEAMEQRLASTSEARDFFRREWKREREKSRLVTVCHTPAPIEHKLDWKENLFFGFFVGLILLGGWKLVELIATLIF